MVPASVVCEFTEGPFPHVVSAPRFTPAGTPFLIHPTVALISKPQVQLEGMLKWVRTFGVDEGSTAAVEAWCLDIDDTHPDTLGITDGEKLIKAQGQLCYASYLGKFTPNSELPQYLENINKQGHGSVTEGANYTFFFGGVSRSWSHEAVRHRAGMSPAQLSQRYVDGRALRFIMRPEYRKHAAEVDRFMRRCDWYAGEYEDLARRLIEDGIIDTTGMSKTDARKAVNQVAREVLPNSTETAIVITGNARAWRHFLNMRASKHAEPEIRRTAWWVAQILKCKEVAPHLFADVTLTTNWWDGASITYIKP